MTRNAIIAVAGLTVASAAGVGYIIYRRRKSSAQIVAAASSGGVAVSAGGAVSVGSSAVTATPTKLAITPNPPQHPPPPPSPLGRPGRDVQADPGPPTAGNALGVAVAALGSVGGTVQLAHANPNVGRVAVGGIQVRVRVPAPVPTAVSIASDTRSLARVPFVH